MKYRTDLILGEAFCVFIFFYFLDSGLSVLNGSQFYFLLRDSENPQFIRTVISNGVIFVTERSCAELEIESGSSGLCHSVVV